MDADLHRARADDERARARAVLRRHGALEEHAVGADAGVRRVLADHGAVVRLRLQPRVHRGQRVLRQLRPAVPEGHVRSAKGEFAMAATFSKGAPMPELVFVAFQATFAAITVLPDPRRVRRARRSSRRCWCSSVLWFTFAYMPDRAHGVVLGGPGRVHGRERRRRDEREGRPASGRWGALDFAGGTVVHINAGIAGLVGAYRASASASATARKRWRRTTCR